VSDALLIEVTSSAIRTLLFVMAPLLLGMLIVGFAVSLFQAVTQVNEPTLVFIPKLAVTFVLLLFAGPWMADQMLQFTTNMFTMLPVLAR
jgi:flagellar biosynthetic protein FliQ